MFCLYFYFCEFITRDLTESINEGEFIKKILEWSSKIISADVKANVKQQEIKDMVIAS